MENTHKKYKETVLKKTFTAPLVKQKSDQTKFVLLLQNNLQLAKTSRNFQKKNNFSLTVFQCKSAIRNLLQDSFAEKQELRFLNILEIEAEAAKILATFPGKIHLGIKTISHKSAEELANHQASLFLPNIKELSPEIAQILIQHRGLLVFQLSKISNEVAKILTTSDEFIVIGTPEMDDETYELLFYSGNIMF